jgi:hypothetical protein
VKAWTRGIVVVVVGSILLHLCVLAALQVYFRSSEYRFPFPAEKVLTEQDAVELSKRALILDGKRSDTMRPVLSGHKDAEGHEVIFCTGPDNPDRGWVLWSLGRPDRLWEYLVVVTRQGDEIVCIIGKPH